MNLFFYFISTSFYNARKFNYSSWKEEQKKFSKTHRRYFKNSKKLLLKRFNKSENEQQQQVLVMLETSVNLSRSHWYKEKFLEILDCNDRETAKEKMQEWIYNASNCGIPQFEKCADPMQNRLTGILNSFSSPYTNGFTEGCNNKIKVLNRNAYGYKNFRRFRTAYKAFLNWRVSNTKWSPILSEFQNINQYAVNE